MATWLRALDALVNLKEITERVMAGAEKRPALRAPSGSPLDPRLAAGVAAAVREAFDRDQARMDLWRERLAADERRAQETRRLDMLARALEREASRLVAVAWIAVVAWGASAIALASLGGGSLETAPRAAAFIGWLTLALALGAALAGHRALGPELDRARSSGASTLASPALAGAASWLLVAGLLFTGSGVAMAL